MNLTGFISALQKYFNDILGSLLPGLILLYGFKFVMVFDLWFPGLSDITFETHAISIVCVAFLMGHLLDQVYQFSFKKISQMPIRLAIALIVVWAFLFAAVPNILIAFLFVWFLVILCSFDVPKSIMSLLGRYKKSNDQSDASKNTASVHLIDCWFYTALLKKFTSDDGELFCKELEKLKALADQKSDPKSDANKGEKMEDIPPREFLSRSERQSIAMSLTEEAQELGRRFSFISLLCSSTGIALIMINIVAVNVNAVLAEKDLLVIANFDKNVSLGCFLLSWLLIWRAGVFRDRSYRASIAIAASKILS